MNEAFDFGENWEKLVGLLSESNVQHAIQDMNGFFGRSMAGMSFLDIGSGSGLSSLAAHRLGASVTSVDLDQKNIENLKALRLKFSVPADAKWKAFQGSAFDGTLPPSDIVYSWGVLHHTGDMWRALENCARLVNPGGYLYLMLYRDSYLAPVWKHIKRFYSTSGQLTQAAIARAYAACLILGLLAKRRNPLRFMREYPQKTRGMNWYLDVVDWVGGYPFEYASAKQVSEFVCPRGFRLLRVEPQTKRPVGVMGAAHQYLFQRE